MLGYFIFWRLWNAFNLTYQFTSTSQQFWKLMPRFTFTFERHLYYRHTDDIHITCFTSDCSTRLHCSVSVTWNTASSRNHYCRWQCVSIIHRFPYFLLKYYPYQNCRLFPYPLNRMWTASHVVRKIMREILRMVITWYPDLSPTCAYSKSVDKETVQTADRTPQLLYIMWLLR